MARIDKWLWATRIFKTRTIATDACKKGRITINGVAVKPSRLLQVGEIVNVKKPPITYTYEVIGLIENRIGAKLVPQYLKNITPKSQYDLLEMTRISGFVNRQKGLGRPTKKEGRALAEFNETCYFDDFDDDDLADSLYDEYDNEYDNDYDSEFNDNPDFELDDYYSRLYNDEDSNH